jgi:RNA recognition motif-containing protein
MSTRLHVGNLPRGTNEATLRMAFGENRRRVVAVTIATDAKTGRLQQFGTVDMATREDALAAMEAWHGRDLDGRNLTVNW